MLKDSTELNIELTKLCRRKDEIAEELKISNSSVELLEETVINGDSDAGKKLERAMSRRDSLVNMVTKLNARIDAVSIDLGQAQERERALELEIQAQEACDEVEAKTRRRLSIERDIDQSLRAGVERLLQAQRDEEEARAAGQGLLLELVPSVATGMRREVLPAEAIKSAEALIARLRKECDPDFLLHDPTERGADSVFGAMVKDHAKFKNSLEFPTPIDMAVQIVCGAAVYGPGQEPPRTLSIQEIRTAGHNDPLSRRLQAA